MMREIRLNKESVTVTFETVEEVEQFQALFDAYNHGIDEGSADNLTFTISENKELRERNPKIYHFSILHCFEYAVLRNYHPFSKETFWNHDHKDDGSYCTKDLLRLRLKDKDVLFEIEVFGKSKSPNGLCYDSNHYYGRYIDYWKCWNKNEFITYTKLHGDEDRRSFEFVEGETEMVIKFHKLH